MLPAKFSAKLNKHFIPFDASFELTYRCNHDCIMCYQSDHNDIQGELKTDDIKNILDQLAGAGCLFIAFTGGEPFLRSDFMSILDYASEKSFAINIQTNGTLIDDIVIDKLKSFNIIQMHISLLGANAVTHDGITRRKGSFDKAVNIAKKLRREGFSVFFKITVLKDNHTELEEMISLSKSLDCYFIVSPMIVPMNNGDKAPLKYRISDEDMKKIFSISKKESLNDLRFVPEDENVPDEFGLCSMARSTCAISPKGDLYPCVGMPISLGNLKGDNFEDVWNNSKRASEIRKMDVNDLKDCVNCDLNDSCLYCPGLSYLENNNCAEPSGELCRMAKFVKEVNCGK